MTKPKKLTGTKSAKSHTTKKKKAKPGASALTDTTYSGYANDTQLSSPPIPVQQISPDSIIPKSRDDRKKLIFGPGRAVFQPQYGVQISTN